MSETYLDSEQSVKKRNHRMDVAAGQFHEAAAMAAVNGLRLRCCTEVHYQLKPADGAWLMNIYPSNRRLYADPQKRGPFLRVPDNWTLLDVVKAACKTRMSQ